MENQRHRVSIKRPAFSFHMDGKVFLFIFGKYLNIVELCQILLVKPARHVHGTRLHSLYSSPALSLWPDMKHSPSPDQAYFASQKEGTLCVRGWALGGRYTTELGTTDFRSSYLLLLQYYMSSTYRSSKVYRYNCLLTSGPHQISDLT